jgi:hypothetical protein
LTNEVQPAEPAVSDKSKRRWYQFSLWEFFVMMAVVGLGLSVGAEWGRHRQYCLEQVSFHELQVQRFRTMISKDRDKRLWHEGISNQYRRAAWRPWLRFWIDDRLPYEVMTQQDVARWWKEHTGEELPDYEPPDADHTPHHELGGGTTR